MTSRRPRRSWGSRLRELVVWIGIAIATALILISLSERLLPTNF